MKFFLPLNFSCLASPLPPICGLLEVIRESLKKLEKKFKAFVKPDQNTFEITYRVSKQHHQEIKRIIFFFFTFRQLKPNVCISDYTFVNF